MYYACEAEEYKHATRHSYSSEEKVALIKVFAVSEVLYLLPIFQAVGAPFVAIRLNYNNAALAGQINIQLPPSLRFKSDLMKTVLTASDFVKPPSLRRR